MHLRHLSAVAVGLALLVVTATPATAAEQLVVTSCVATVPPGAPIALAASAVTQPVVDLLTPIDPTGLLVPAFLGSWAKEPPISLPADRLDGPGVADAVLGRLATVPVLAPVLASVTGPLRAQLARSCGITVAAQGKASPPEPASMPSVVGTIGVVVVPGSRIAPTEPAEGPPPEPAITTPEPPVPQFPPLTVTPLHTAAQDRGPVRQPTLFGWVVTTATLLFLLASAHLGRRARRPRGGVQRAFRPSAGHHRKP